MKKKKRTRIKKGKERIALIVCYHKDYVLRSRNRIEQILTRERPSKVMILNITEVKSFSHGIGGYLTASEMRTLQDHFKEDKRIRSRQYGKTIDRLCASLKIPTKIVERKGDASIIILEEIKRYDPCCVVIHRKEETRLDKILSGSIEDDVLDKDVKKRVYVLE